MPWFSALILIMDSLANASFLRQRLQVFASFCMDIPCQGSRYHIDSSLAINRSIEILQVYICRLGRFRDIINQGVNMNKSKGIDREIRLIIRI